MFTTLTCLLRSLTWKAPRWIFFSKITYHSIQVHLKSQSAWKWQVNIPPVVTQAAVIADLLQTREILTQLVVEAVRHHLCVLAVLDIFLSVEEPVGDLVLARVWHDRQQLLHLQQSISNIKCLCREYIVQHIRGLRSCTLLHDSSINSYTVAESNHYGSSTWNIHNQISQSFK